MRHLDRLKTSCFSSLSPPGILRAGTRSKVTFIEALASSGFRLLNIGSQTAFSPALKKTPNPGGNLIPSV